MSRFMNFGKTRMGLPAGGVGALALTFLGVAASSTLSCHEPKDPKSNQITKQTNQRRNMKQTKFLNRTNNIIKRTIPILITAGLTTNLLLTGCASETRKEDSINAILAKENVLIEKVKLERAQPGISQGVVQNENLRSAEAHLSLTLDGILQANEIVMTKLNKQNGKEETNGQNERSSH